MSTTRICAHCGQQFATITDHLTHVMQQHDTGFVSRQSGRRLLRPSTCSRCASEIAPDADHCQCGALHPRHTKAGA